MIIILNSNKAKAIIANYKPHKGFFDLSNKPSTLSEIEYAKLLNSQNFLAEQNTKENIEYLKTFEPTQFRDLQKLSANIQQIIFEHWGNKIFK